MIEVVAFDRTTNQAVAIKEMDLQEWKSFNRFTNKYYYKAYQLGYSQYNLVHL